MSRRALEFIAGCISLLLCAFITTQLPVGQRLAPTLVNFVFAAFVLYRFWKDVVAK